MNDQRGVSLVELLIAATIGTAVLASLLSFYLATARSLDQSSAQAALQRQGSLALDEIARQVRSAVGPNAISLATCDGVANSVRILSPDADVCYYARQDGALCEFRNGQCRDLLAGGLDRVVLLVQSDPADPRCPPVAAAARCFAMAPNAAHPQSQVDVAFAIRHDPGDAGGIDAMAFAISLTCSGRNC
jgi:hypothetical protein